MTNLADIAIIDNLKSSRMMAQLRAAALLSERNL